MVLCSMVTSQTFNLGDLTSNPLLSILFFIVPSTPCWWVSTNHLVSPILFRCSKWSRWKKAWILESAGWKARAYTINLLLHINNKDLGRKSALPVSNCKLDILNRSLGLVVTDYIFIIYLQIRIYSIFLAS